MIGLSVGDTVLVVPLVKALRTAFPKAIIYVVANSAVSPIFQNNPDIHFVWAGGEPSTVASWRAILEQAGVKNVRLMGFVPNERLPLVQAACDVLLMPYERKISGSSGGDTAQFASPMKQFEYLASGRAILASDLPVFREVLNDRNAILLPPEDVAAWHKALNQLTADDNRRNSLAEQARKDAVQYDWRTRGQRILEGLE